MRTVRQFVVKSGRMALVSSSQQLPLPDAALREADGVMSCWVTYDGDRAVATGTTAAHAIARADAAAPASSA